MIVVMNSNSTPADIRRVGDLLDRMGLRHNVVSNAVQPIIEALGGNGRSSTAEIEAAPMVEKVFPRPLAFRSARDGAPPATAPVEIAPQLAVGGVRLAVIAGPCAVEDRAQLLDAAHAVKQAGAFALRGGAFKPRTSPYTFQGRRELGLEWLAEAREQTGLAIVTEVMAIEQIPVVSQFADVLQVGSRNMQNYPLLVAVGQSGKPVLLKRGWSATLEEFLLSAEYVLNEGNERVILCERGIRTFETHVRNTLALATVPHVKQTTRLPILVDPSHGTGRDDLVAAMSRAAIAAGADGLLVEVHPDPAAALSDGAQSLTPAAFAALMTSLAPFAAAVNRTL